MVIKKRRKWLSFSSQPQSVRPRRLTLEALEDRTVPTVAITNTLPYTAQGPGPIGNFLQQTSSHGGIVSDDVGAVESIVTVPYQVQGFFGLTFTHYVAYAGTVNGGVWRTDDLVPNDSGTTQWRPLTDQQASL